jgi:hypothetical protein
MKQWLKNLFTEISDYLVVGFTILAIFMLIIGLMV